MQPTGAGDLVTPMAGRRTGGLRATLVAMSAAAALLTACSAAPARGTTTYGPSAAAPSVNAGLGAGIPIGKPAPAPVDSAAAGATRGGVNAGLGAGVPIGGAQATSGAPAISGTPAASVRITGAVTESFTTPGVVCVTNKEQLVVSITSVKPAFSVSITMTPKEPHTLKNASFVIGGIADIQPGKPPISYTVNGPDGSGPQQSTLTQLAAGLSPKFHLTGPTYYSDPDSGKWFTANLDVTATCGGVGTVGG